MDHSNNSNKLLAHNAILIAENHYLISFIYSRHYLDALKRTALGGWHCSCLASKDRNFEPGKNTSLEKPS